MKCGEGVFLSEFHCFSLLRMGACPGEVQQGGEGGGSEAGGIGEGGCGVSEDDAGLAGEASPPQTGKFLRFWVLGFRLRN